MEQKALSDSDLVARGFLYQGLKKQVYVGGKSSGRDDSITMSVARRYYDRQHEEEEDDTTSGIREIIVPSQGISPHKVERAAKVLNIHLDQPMGDVVVLNDESDGEETASTVLLAYLMIYLNKDAPDAIESIRQAALQNSTMPSPRPLTSSVAMEFLQYIRGNKTWVRDELPPTDHIKVTLIEEDILRQHKRRRTDESNGYMQMTLSQRGVAPERIRESTRSSRRLLKDIMRIQEFSRAQWTGADSGACVVGIAAAHHALFVRPMHLWNSHTIVTVFLGGPSMMSLVPFPERNVVEFMETMAAGLNLSFKRFTPSKHNFLRMIRANGVLIHQPREDRCALVHVSELGPASVLTISAMDPEQSELRVHMNAKPDVFDQLQAGGWFVVDSKFYEIKRTRTFSVKDPELNGHDGPALLVDFSFEFRKWTAVIENGGDDDTCFEHPLDLMVTANGTISVCANIYIPVQSVMRVYGMIRGIDEIEDYPFRYLDMPGDDVVTLLPIRASPWVSRRTDGMVAPVGNRGQYVFEYLNVTDIMSESNVLLEQGKTHGILTLRVTKAIEPGDPIVLYMEKRKRPRSWTSL